MKDKIKYFVCCCGNELRSEKLIYLIPTIFHFIMHIVVGFLLFDYVPNKKIVTVIAFLDIASHYAGIAGIIVFVGKSIKERLKGDSKLKKKEIK